jgi:6,7-dimethyl-8-ribityllumazine synthase
MATAGTDLSAVDFNTLPKADAFSIGLVVAEWNADITENLFNGAKDTLLEAGVPENQIERVNTPGTFELTYGAKRLCEQQTFDAIVAIGTVIQGETKHFDFVCQGVTQGITQLNLDYTTPVIFCVLTDNTKQQSIDRSGGKHGNKGVECAVAAIKMAALKNSL